MVCMINEGTYNHIRGRESEVSMVDVSIDLMSSIEDTTMTTDAIDAATKVAKVIARMRASRENRYHTRMAIAASQTMQSLKAVK